MNLINTLKSALERTECKMKIWKGCC